MAAPQRQIRPISQPVAPAPRKSPRVAGRRDPRLQRKRFVTLVVLPVLLMLDSVYLHTVASNLGAEATALKEVHSGLLIDKERLEVKVSELSAPGRIRTMARENLGMRSAGAKDMRTYDREDGEQNGGQKVQEGSRQ
ncbi:hypothetical protein BH23ACT11_BH23ACT11_03140 [soil metagenome]